MENPEKQDYGSWAFPQYRHSDLNKNYYHQSPATCFSHMDKPCVIVAPGEFHVCGDYDIIYVVSRAGYSEAIDAGKRRKKMQRRGYLAFRWPCVALTINSLTGMSSRVTTTLSRQSLFLSLSRFVLFCFVSMAYKTFKVITVLPLLS